ncbi:MAG: PaaI family thioesterase [Chloroflexota bacterium]|nr:PaaI family thioesterase [Chloroflexota bacterium]
MLLDTILELLQEQHGDRMSEFLLPPPVFTIMEGEFVSFDREAATLTTRFPVLERFFNPYHMVQGGIIAAAVDNTFGPLSMLVAPPNVTRRLEMKYSRPVTMDVEVIVVAARLVAREESTLTFAADVRSPDGTLLARARATHWIL